MKICVLGDELHCDEAKQAGLDFQTTEDLGKFKKDKKMVKKLGNYSFSSSLLYFTIFYYFHL
jgi:large subunit ribosomal protein L10Ae